MYERTGVQQCVTSPYHPPANGLVERVNRTTTDRLKTMICKQAEWVDALQTVAWVHRSTCHASTNYEPLRIMLGSKPKLPCECKNWGTDITKIRDLTEEGVEDIISQTKKENVETLMQIREDVFDGMSGNICRAQKSQEKNYDARHCDRVNSFRFETLS